MNINPLIQADLAQDQIEKVQTIERQAQESDFENGMRHNRRKRLLKMGKIIRLAHKIDSKMHN